MLRFVIAWVFALCAFQIAAGQQPNAPSMATIEGAWKKQAEGIRSLRATWVQVRTYQKGFISADWARLPEKARQLNNPSNAVVPPKDTTVEVPGYFALDGDQVRYETSIPEWSHNLQAFRLIRTKDALTKTGKSLSYMTGGNNDSQPYTAMRDHSGRSLSLEIHTPSIWPLMTALRGADIRFSWCPIARFALTGRTVPIKKVECLELEPKNPGPRNIQRVWVDPGKNYSIVRAVLISNGKIRQQVTIEQHLHEERFWLPGSWEAVTNQGDGKEQKTVRVRLDKYEINPRIPNAHFDFDFPPGTEVYDTATQRTERTPGTFRESDIPELGQDSPQFSRSSIVYLFLTLSVFSGCVLLTIFWWRRRHAPFRGSAPVNH